MSRACASHPQSTLRYPNTMILNSMHVGMYTERVTLLYVAICYTGSRVYEHTCYEVWRLNKVKHQ